MRSSEEKEGGVQCNDMKSNKGRWFLLVPLMLCLCSLSFESLHLSDFIGHADAAEVAICARSIAEGDGPIVNCVWLLTGDPEVELAHRIRYFSLYVSYWVAAFFYGFGANSFAAFLAAWCARACIAVSAFIYCRGRGCARADSLACMAVILFVEVPWGDRTDLFSDIFVSAATMAVFLVATRYYRSPTRWKALVLGVLTGITIGIKPTGVIYLLLPVLFCWKKTPREFFASCALFCIGVTVSVSPLVYNNWMEARTLVWPDVHYLKVANAGGRAAGLGYDRIAYGDPAMIPNSEGPNLKHALKRKILHVHKFFRRIFDREHRIGNDFLLICCGVLLFKVLRYPKQSTFDETLAAAIMVISIGFVLTVAHYEFRYFIHILAPVAAVSVAVGCKRVRQFWRVFAVLAILQSAALAAHELREIQDVGLSEHRKGKDTRVAKIDFAKENLPSDAIVFSHDPWEFTFHSRLPSVVLPVVDTWKQIEQFRERYSVTHIVIYDEKHRSPLYDKLASGKSDGPATVLVSENGVVIAELAD